MFIHEVSSHITYYCIAQNFRGTKFSWISWLTSRSRTFCSWNNLNACHKVDYIARLLRKGRDNIESRKFQEIMKFLSRKFTLTLIWRDSRNFWTTKIWSYTVIYKRGEWLSSPVLRTYLLWWSRRIIHRCCAWFLKHFLNPIPYCVRNSEVIWNRLKNYSLEPRLSVLDFVSQLRFFSKAARQNPERNTWVWG